MFNWGQTVFKILIMTFCPLLLVSLWLSQQRVISIDRRPNIYKYHEQAKMQNPTKGKPARINLFAGH